MKTRLTYIDSLKGLAILSIVFLHFEDGIIPHWLNNWIGLFMITAFYLAAGVIYGTRGETLTPKQVLKKRYPTLIKPYIRWSLIILVFDLLWCLTGEYNGYFLVRETYKTLCLRGIGTLWFIPSLLGAELIFTTLQKWDKWYIYLFAFIAILGLTEVYGYYAGQYRNMSNLTQIIDAPLRAIKDALYAVPILAVGYWLAKPLSHATKHNTLKYLPLGVALFVGSLAYVRYIPFHIPYIAHILCPLSVMVILYALPTLHYLSYWGRNSLFLMVTHYSITLVILKYIDKVLLHILDFTGWRTIVYFVICIVLTHIGLYIKNLYTRYVREE